MSDFWIFVEIGLKHVLNSSAYDHILFLMALTASHTVKDWRRLLILTTVFTIGHTAALFLAVLRVLSIDESLVEFFIPITILIAAILNFVLLKKTLKKDKIISVAGLTLFFGVIHGLGFSNYFKSILPGRAVEKVLPLVQFSIGIEVAQVVIVFWVLSLSFMAERFFKVSKRDFSIVVSAFIIGVVTPMIINNQFWSTVTWN